MKSAILAMNGFETALTMDSTVAMIPSSRAWSSQYEAAKGAYVEVVLLSRVKEQQTTTSLIQRSLRRCKGNIGLANAV